MDRITVEMGPSSQVNLRVASLKTTLATKLPSRVLLPAIAKCYGEIANASKVRCASVLPTHLLLYFYTYIVNILPQAIMEFRKCRASHFIEKEA